MLSYLNGELPSRQRSRFEWHLRICRECRDYLAAYQRAAELGRVVSPSPNEPVPEDVPEDLIKAILDACQRCPSELVISLCGACCCASSPLQIGYVQVSAKECHCGPCAVAGRALPQ